MVEVVLHVGKRAKFGLEKVNGGQNICSVGNGRILKNKLSTLRVKRENIITLLQLLEFKQELASLLARSFIAHLIHSIQR